MRTTAKRNAALSITVPGHRDGIALMVVIVAVAIVTGLAHSLSLTIVRRHQQIDRQIERAQTRWLAESALLRGSVLQNRDPAWTGETWSPVLPAGGFPSNTNANVEIEASGSAESASNIIRVSAVVTFGPQRSTNIKRTWNRASENSSDLSEELP